MAMNAVNNMRALVHWRRTIPELGREPLVERPRIWIMQLRVISRIILRMDFVRFINWL